MKKFLSVLLTVILAFSVAGCNDISDNSSEDTENSLQIETTENYSYRIFDTKFHNLICDNLMPMFAICANINWDNDNNSPLLEAVDTNVFKFLVERLYSVDTGKEFDNEEGRISVDTYVEYGTKYFNFEAQDIQTALENSHTYNAADDTVLMHDGLGSVIGVNVIAVTPADDRYIIDYIVSYPEDVQCRYASMAFTINDDGSYKFLSNRFTDTSFEPSYTLKDFGYPYRNPIATSKDDRYEIYYTDNTRCLGENYAEYRLRDTYTDSFKSLGFVVKNQITDAGFFANGDVYTMDYSGLYMHSADMTDGSIAFTTKTNFNAGSFIGFDSTERYVFSIRRDPETFDYIVIYGEYVEDPDYEVAHPNNFQLAYNYKVGLLDKEGNLTQSWDTDIPIMHSAYGFESVYMTKPNKNEIEFFTMYNDEERFRARFDLSTGICTTLKRFDVPADEKLATVKQLSEQWVPVLSVWLGSDWDSSVESLDFGLHITLMNLYRMDKNIKFPVIAAKQPNNYIASEAIRVSDLVPVAEKFFIFDTDKLYDYYCSLPGYDENNDSIILSDGWGWSLSCKVKDVIAVGEYYEIHYDLVTTEDTVEYSKILTVSLQPDGYLKYISNKTVN